MTNVIDGRDDEAGQTLPESSALPALVPTEGNRPTVAAIEWMEPLMAAGNWVPEQQRA